MHLISRYFLLHSSPNLKRIAGIPVRENPQCIVKRIIPVTKRKQRSSTRKLQWRNKTFYQGNCCRLNKVQESLKLFWCLTAAACLSSAYVRMFIRCVRSLTLEKLKKIRWCMSACHLFCLSPFSMLKKTIFCARGYIYIRYILLSLLLLKKIPLHCLDSFFGVFRDMV